MFGKLGRWLLNRVAARTVPAPDLEKRAAARAMPVPDAWRAIVTRELPHYNRLTAEQREKFFGDLNVFVAEKTIVGIEGFVVDDRAKVLVAASAALLVLGRDIAIFDHVTRIAIRPDVVGTVGGEYKTMKRERADEVFDSWGEVEIAWTQIASAFETLEGQNTALHELAHAIDHADGQMDALMSHEHFDRWRAKLHELPLASRIEGWNTITAVIADADGPELFAVATELFFECPHKLQRLDSTLFDAMCAIYGLDPRTLTDR